MIRDTIKYSSAIELRQSGKSIRNIASTLKISTSTASIWCRDVILTLKQQESLNFRGQNRLFLKQYSQKRHEDKIKRHASLLTTSKREIQKLNKEEMFKVGVALYWAEGFKNIREGRVGFCNSDPRMIKFIMYWFRKSLNIPDQDFILRVEFNIQHQERKDEIERYWSAITKIPLSQFNKPYLQRTNQIRDYKNRGPYYGMLRIRIRRSLNLLVKLQGWIEGLSLAYE